MSNQKHTPTPWHVDGKAIYATGICLVGSTHNNSSTITHEQDLANAERIVACVNAMDGIEDPQKFVDVTREQIKEGAKAKATLELIEKAISDITLNDDNDGDIDDFDFDYDPGELIMKISDYLSTYYGEKTGLYGQELDNSILEDQAEK